MDAYLKQFREMLSLRGLTDHTVTSYSTHVRVYLGHLSDTLHKMPEDVSWGELRDVFRWLQKDRNLSDLKFKALLCLMFSSGLRIGEARHLKCPDIGHFKCRASKNRSSRYAQLSERAWQIALQYWHSLPAGDSRRTAGYGRRESVSSSR